MQKNYGNWGATTQILQRGAGADGPNLFVVAVYSESNYARFGNCSLCRSIIIAFPINLIYFEIAYTFSYLTQVSVTAVK